MRTERTRAATRPRRMDEPARRRVYRRRRTAVVSLLLIVVVLFVYGVDHLAGGGGSRAAATSGSTTTAATTTTTTVPPTTTSTTGPGALPQTGAFPTTTSPIFSAGVAALWSGVSTGVVTNALPAFFPAQAYVQLKSIANAQGDYSDRLVTEFEADVAAAHQLLGPDAAAAKFIAVNVDSAYAHWVPSGVCDNDVGYFELPNSRVIYSINGQVSSFGIASMISWRGEWYIVHLGAILRSGSGGEVASPTTGPGSPVYSSTC